MFQQKIDETLNDLPNVFGTADNNLVVGYDSNEKDQDDILWKVLQICRQVNQKLNISPILWGSHIESWSMTQPMKAESAYKDAPPKQKRNFMHFLE